MLRLLGKKIIAFLPKKFCLTGSMSGSLEHPKHMLRLLGKKIIAFLPKKFCLTGSMSGITLHYEET